MSATVETAPTKTGELDEGEQLEIRLAELIEGYGNDLIALAERLRMSPFVAIEERFSDVVAGVIRAEVAGRKIKREHLALARGLLRKLADERIPVGL